MLAPVPAVEHRSSINGLVEKREHKDSDNCSRVGKQPQGDISKLCVIVANNQHLRKMNNKADTFFIIYTLTAEANGNF